MWIVGGIPAGTDPVQALYELGFSRKDARGFVRWHAHELAEKQRAKLIADGYGPLDEDDDGICPCGGCSWCLAQDYIDLIDPEKQ